VISEIYGAGGNSGAVYNADFVELHNRTGQSMTLSGWALQYASTAGSSWSVAVIPPNTSVGAGGYLLLALGPLGTNGVALPSGARPLSRTIDMSSTSGKVAFTSSSTALSGSCPTADSIVDFVGYGTANCAAGNMAAPTLSASHAALRGSSSGASEACTDTAVNGADFTAGAPLLHGSMSNVCACP
jgi:hypothetical protein